MHTILSKSEQEIFPMNWQAPGVIEPFTVSPQGVV